MNLQTAPNDVTGPNAGGPRQFPIRTPQTARVGLALNTQCALHDSRSSGNSERPPLPRPDPAPLNSRPLGVRYSSRWRVGGYASRRSRTRTSPVSLHRKYLLPSVEDQLVRPSLVPRSVLNSVERSANRRKSREHLTRLSARGEYARALRWPTVVARGLSSGPAVV